MPNLSLDVPGFDTRTPEQILKDRDIGVRRETVGDIVRDLSAWLPDLGITARQYLDILARVRGHASTMK